MNIYARVLASLIPILLFACSSPKVIREPDTSKALKIRSYDTYQNDKNLEKVILFELRQKYPKLQDAYLLAKAYASRILVVGYVQDPTMAQQLTAEKGSFSTLNIKYFHNFIQNNPPLGLTQRSSDTVLHGELVLHLSSYPNFDSQQIELLVHDAVVYVFGFVTQKQSLTVIDILSQVRGVRQVVTVFDYIDMQGNQIPTY